MKRNIIILAIALCTTMGAWAQSVSSLRTGYFNDRMYSNYKLNPALANDFNHLALPVLGGVGIGVNSNLGLNDFLFPDSNNINGELKSFLHPDISISDFASGLKSKNSISQSFDVNILSLGFFGFKGYNTFSISVKESMTMTIPEDMFMLLKGGQSSYDLSNLGLKGSSYAEVAFGHSRKISEQLTVGASVKALVGLAYADFGFSNTVVTMSDDVWKLSADASGSLAALGSVIDLNDDDELEFGDSYGPAGFGLAIDLGATYEVFENFTVSLALTDIGYIAWNNVSTIGIEGGESTLLDYSDTFDYETAEDEISDKLEGLTDEFESMLEIGDVQPGGSKAGMLSATLTAGAEYTMFDNLLSFGLLSTTTFSSATFSELMAVVGVNPLKSLNLSVSGSVSTNGSYWGCLLSFCPRGFINFYIGADSMIGSVTPQFYPIKALNTSVRFGLAIPLGGNRSTMDKALM